MQRPIALMGKPVILAALLLAGAARAGTTTSGDLYFDTLNTTLPFGARPVGPATVQSVHYTYDRRLELLPGNADRHLQRLGPKRP